MLARRGANLTDHEVQLRSVFGEGGTAKVLKDDALIGKLSRSMLDEAEENGQSEGVDYKFPLIYNTIIFQE